MRRRFGELWGDSQNKSACLKSGIFFRDLVLATIIKMMNRRGSVVQGRSGVHNNPIYNSMSSFSAAVAFPFLPFSTLPNYPNPWQGSLLIRQFETLCTQPCTQNSMIHRTKHFHVHGIGLQTLLVMLALQMSNSLQKKHQALFD